jgi:hypothetical protein
VKREEAFPPARVTIWVVRPDMQRVVVVEPISERGVRQARAVEALDKATARVKDELLGCENQIKLFRDVTSR